MDALRVLDLYGGMRGDDEIVIAGAVKIFLMLERGERHKGHRHDVALTTSRMLFNSCGRFAQFYHLALDIFLSRGVCSNEACIYACETVDFLVQLSNERKDR